MPMPPVIVIVAGADRDTEIFRLCGSCGTNGRKTQNDGSDCNVFHAYPPNASCWERKAFRVRSVPRFDFAKHVRNAKWPAALIWGPWKIFPPSQKGAVWSRVRPLTRLSNFYPSETKRASGK